MQIRYRSISSEGVSSNFEGVMALLDLEIMKEVSQNFAIFI